MFPANVQAARMANPPKSMTSRLPVRSAQEVVYLGAAHWSPWAAASSHAYWNATSFQRSVTPADTAMAGGHLGAQQHRMLTGLGALKCRNPFRRLDKYTRVSFREVMARIGG